MALVFFVTPIIMDMYKFIFTTMCTMGLSSIDYLHYLMSGNLNLYIHSCTIHENQGSRTIIKLLHMLSFYDLLLVGQLRPINMSILNLIIKSYLL